MSFANFPVAYTEGIIQPAYLTHTRVVSEKHFRYIVIMTRWAELVKAGFPSIAAIFVAIAGSLISSLHAGNTRAWRTRACVDTCV